MSHRLQFAGIPICVGPGGEGRADAGGCTAVVVEGIAVPDTREDVLDGRVRVLVHGRDVGFWVTDASRPTHT